MQLIRNIHRTIFTHMQQMYKFDISRFDIKSIDNSNDILKKIEALVHVSVYPDEYMILKRKENNK